MRDQMTSNRDSGLTAPTRIGPGDLLGDAVQILKLVRMKYGNLHEPTCAFVKSSRRKWGRTEPCNCWIVERNQAIERIMNEYEKLR
jgi:hypothetical protein